MSESADADVALNPAEKRRLDLLRQVGDAGGALTPVPAPSATHGYAYAVVGEDVENDLSHLVRRNYLETRFFDRVSLCPRCGSHHLNLREVCPSCRSAHLTSEGLLHHFRCGYVGIPSEFLPVADGGYRCPKCNGVMRHPGTEFDRLGRAFVCRGCGVISENPPVEAVCFVCNARVPAENLVSTVVFTYVLTSRGACAVRGNSFFDDDEEAATDGRVYKRPVILEFVEHELKRRRQLNAKFSVLLAKYTRNAADPNPSGPPAQWLNRLRSRLREVDLVGQLTDALYLVILPETKQGQAEATCRRIAAGLGSESPFTLSAVEIKEQQDLVKILGEAGRRDPQ